MRKSLAGILNTIPFDWLEHKIESSIKINSSVILTRVPASEFYVFQYSEYEQPANLGEVLDYYSFAQTGHTIAASSAVIDKSFL